MQNKYRDNLGNSQAVTRIRLVPTRRPHVSRIELHLEQEVRHIGTLDASGEGTLYLRRTQKQVHRRTNSIGINAELVDRFGFRWVQVDFEGEALVTTRSFLRAHSRSFTFERAGFERQRFMALTDWGRERALDFEAETCHQGELSFGGVAAWT